MNFQFQKIILVKVVKILPGSGFFAPNFQEEESAEEDPREAIVHEHPLFEGTSEELLGDGDGW